MTKSPKKQTDLDAFEAMLDDLIAEAKRHRIPHARQGDLVHVKLAVQAVRKAREA
jgi:hypothetical protein